ncbi:DUF4062 domain-containing protein [Flavobacterium wongokense]|uniref:DUF4062 domain-containing protein n=1 Tax=Flavobacterium wongokense TaxID=2910674 RepID=UPI001F189184|nr:DUF4062 domain-containing protein [Flavobacterium sp. WG47]MCF6132543.1 DUF4062 domain-containing protein [Flavobacterium sp. WG47]
MAKTQTEVLRVFLSSTAIDMEKHRQEVSNSILRLNNLPVKMESFGAQPSSPVAVCKAKLEEANAIVVMIANRYGWVPTVEEGGDGKKSITWIEIETAMDKGIPIFAYILDEKYIGWNQPSEQDQLENAKTQEEAIEVYEKVKNLKELKTFLNTKAGLVREKFTTPDNLASKVTSDIANWLLKASNATITATITTKKQTFRYHAVHPLQPAPHFRGRKQLLEELLQWWGEPVTPDRVRSLVAIGGTGKTAIIEHFLKTLDKKKLVGNILVWSFYDEPNTDAFLKEACIFFTGKEPDGIGGKLEILQRTLGAENNQNLIVLDGLERVQSEGKGNSIRAKGDLEDHRLKNLLRAITIGLGNTRALITSRFKLTDLEQWENAGYKSHDLEVLDHESAVEVLKAWEVKGSDEKLLHIAESVGRHALSVSVLGSYLNHYCNCDPDQITEFSLEEISPDEPQAAKLARILGGYAKSLPDEERDFIIRLSAFPNGVTINIFGYLIDAGGKIAGALTGINQAKLARIAEKLKKQGLIYSYNKSASIVYTAHPFLRDYFRKLLGIKPEDIHNVVRNELAIGLDTKPENKPTDSETLDRYEALIEHNILAGHYENAISIYIDVMSGRGVNCHLYHEVGDYSRLMRIISYFCEDGRPENLSDQIDDTIKNALLSELALASIMLGDLKSGESSVKLEMDISLKSKLFHHHAQGLQNYALVNSLLGKFPLSKQLLEKSFEYIEIDMKERGYREESKMYVKRSSTGHLSYIYYCLGETQKAKEYFDKATEMYDGQLFSASSYFEFEFLHAIGKNEEAVLKAKMCLDTNILKDLSITHYYLGILALPDSISEAYEHLQKIQEWTDRSGEMLSVIYSYMLSSEIAYCSGNLPAALSEATTALNHAENCGYGKIIIDTQLLLAKIYLTIPDYNSALAMARSAYEKSAHDDCQYAWGIANGLHLCGVCHIGLGNQEDLARMRLEKALEIREKIKHPEVEETRKLLSELSPKKK